jgi:hypothetical protein
VSELLFDPEYVDEIVQIKRAPSVNLRGENILGKVNVKTVGCVVPASGKTIFKLPEDFRVADLYEFIIQGTITATAPGKYSDQLVFKGEVFNVQLVFDYSNWGAGFCAGTCIRQVPA